MGIMNHFEIEKIMLFRDPETGVYFRVNREDPEATKPEDFYPAFGPNVAVDRRMENLLAAAPMLYQQLTMQSMALSKLIAQLDAMPAPNDGTGQYSELRTTFEQLQNGCILAQQIAQFGIEKVAKGLDIENGGG